MYIYAHTLIIHILVHAFYLKILCAQLMSSKNPTKVAVEVEGVTANIGGAAAVGMAASAKGGAAAVLVG